jgi:hypothetical protein
LFFDVAGAPANVPSVAVTVRGGRDAGGNTVAPKTQKHVFALDITIAAAFDIGSIAEDGAARELP